MKFCILAISLVFATTGWSAGHEHSAPKVNKPAPAPKKVSVKRPKTSSTSTSFKSSGASKGAAKATTSKQTSSRQARMPYILDTVKGVNADRAKAMRREYLSTPDKHSAVRAAVADAIRNNDACSSNRESDGCIDAQLKAVEFIFQKRKNSTWLRKHVERDLAAFVRKQSRRNGKFAIRDEIQNTMRNLKLVKIHTNKILVTPDGTSFVCADFKDQNGDNVDLDFFITPSLNGAVKKVNRMKVHKVNGDVRYTYAMENNVWVEEAVKAKKKL